ncbi:MAG: large subunit ribosomal protein [Candidatus Hydrogenedentes bacterium]|nr:large subunit ribosomal protein [Candidatus Hydrogenedentota bacterium]
MYAMVATGGKQIKVSEGDVVRVEKLEAFVGDIVELDQVRLLVKEDGIVADPAALTSAKVVCQVTGQGRRKKIRVFKKKRRKGYMRTAGHRQSFTELKVTGIQA